MGAIKPFPYNRDTWLYRQLDAFLEGYKLTMDCCYNDLPEKAKVEFQVPAVLWHGTMRDALTTKDLSGKFLHKTSGKHTGF